MKKLLEIICLGLFTLGVQAQSVTIRVTDEKLQALVGAHLFENGKAVAVTDLNGMGQLQPAHPDYVLGVRYIGFEPFEQRMSGFRGDTLHIKLKEAAAELRMVQVVGSREERQLLQAVTQIEILPLHLINNVNAVRLFEAVDKLPGVTVTDGQLNIRNGSGFAYGAGSRALVVVDGQPLLTPDRNDIRWNFLPVEMIDQVELVKGAHSTLYGSGALTGALHVRTFWAGDQPETRLQTFYTQVGQPRRRELAWWGNDAPNEKGLAFAHGQRFGQVDVVAGINLIDKRSFILNTDEQQQRYSLKTRWRPEQIKGLTIGLQASYMRSEEADYIVWNDADSGAFIPLRGNAPDRFDGVVRIDREQIQLTPEVKYLSRGGWEHELHGRWYRLGFLNFSVNLLTNLYTAEYRVKKQLNRQWQWQGGVNAQNFDVFDPNGIGNHEGQTRAAYSEVQAHYGRFRATAGLRYEQFDVINLPRRQAPIGNLGMNYALSEKSALRASIGQGFRFPSVSEMFVNKPNDRLKIFPNPDLVPERGWSAEVGYKQAFRINTWQLYADAALFMMDYRDMTEFVLTSRVPDSVVITNPAQLIDYLGFQAQNLTRARIGGMEFSVNSQGKIGRFPLRMLTGYTYTYPVDVGNNPALAGLGAYWGQLFQSWFSSSVIYTFPLLKYRNRHLFKLDLETGIDQWMIGVDFRYYSKIERVDNDFLGFIPGVMDYMSQRSGNEYIFNLRTGYNFGKYGSLTLLVNNLLNREYTLRFARMEPPRNVTVQYRLRLGS